MRSFVQHHADVYTTRSKNIAKMSIRYNQGNLIVPLRNDRFVPSYRKGNANIRPLYR